MKHANGWIQFGVVLAVAVFVACGGGSDSVGEAAGDLKKAGEDLAGAVEEAGGDMAADVLEKIKATLAEKEEELSAIKEKIAAMSPADLTGSEGSELKKKSEGLMEEIKGLKEKLEAAMNG